MFLSQETSRAAEYPREIFQSGKTLGRSGTPVEPDGRTRMFEYDEDGKEWFGYTFSSEESDLATNWCAMIVGLHFLPLARIFRAPHLIVRGILVTVWCVSCWAFFRSNALVISTSLGTGILLWGSCVFSWFRARKIAQITVCMIRGRPGGALSHRNGASAGGMDSFLDRVLVRRRKAFRVYATTAGASAFSCSLRYSTSRSTAASLCAGARCA